MYPRYFKSMSLLSSLDWMASSMMSGGTSPVGRTTLSRSWVDSSESLTQARMLFLVSSSAAALLTTHSFTARKMSTSGAQKESREIRARTPF